MILKVTLTVEAMKLEERLKEGTTIVSQLPVAVFVRAGSSGGKFPLPSCPGPAWEFGQLR